MEQTITVCELKVPTLTRARGREACDRLRERWCAGPLAIRLDGVSMLALSFLDGMVLGLMDAGLLEQVTFVTQDTRTVAKLERVAGLHPEAALYMRYGPSQERRRVASARVEPEDAPLEASKPLGDSLPSDARPR
jgi:hypothetical protein